MMNCMVLLGDNLAIRADLVRRVQFMFRQTAVTMEDGTQYSTDMSVADVVKSVNAALQSARAALRTPEESP